MRQQPDARYVKLDEIRGLTLLSMILYHFMWDLCYIAGMDFPWYKGAPGHIWQQSICWTFIFLSGFCWSLGRHQLKRGLTVFLAGALVTAVTLLVLPEDRVIFGVLTFLGSAMLLLIPLDRFLSRIAGRTANLLCLAAAMIFFLLFKKINYGYLLPFLVAGTEIRLSGRFYTGWFSAFLGFPPKHFFSTDYFALIPWFFLFLGGYFLYGSLFSRDKDSGALPQGAARLLRTATVPYADFLGRHSLLIYLLHQPVLYAVTQLIMQIC